MKVNSLRELLEAVKKDPESLLYNKQGGTHTYSGGLTKKEFFNNLEKLFLITYSNAHSKNTPSAYFTITKNIPPIE
jgi:hypothetical protein